MKAIKLIDYPNLRQSTDYSCGITTTHSALVYCLGSKDDKPESELFSKLHVTKEGGVDPKSIVKFLRSKGINAILKSLTVEDLKTNIDNDKPVIICIQAWGSQKDYTNVYKEGHYVTVIGYNSGGFIFEDPSIADRNGFIKYGDLDSRWHDIDKSGNKYDHVGIIINCSKKYKPEKLEVIEGIQMETIVESYLNFLYGPVSKIERDIRGPNLPVETDCRHNWIRDCMLEADNRMKINCLRRLKEMTAMNPFYQYRIDRFIDAITQTYEPTDAQGTVPGNQLEKP